MFNVSASVAIDRPIEDVFAYVSDPHKQQNWQPGLYEVKPEGELHTEVRKIMGRRVAHLMKRTEYVPNQTIVYMGTGWGHESLITTRITFFHTGKSTAVTLELDVDTKGMLKSGEPVIERLLQREIKSDLELLKDLLEAHEDLHTAMESKFPKHSDPPR